MPDEKTVLNVAYQSLNQELNRISYLLRPPEDHPFRKYADRIRSKFGASTSQVQNALGKIKQAIDGETSLEEGWKSYVRIKTELMPNLSNELLASIGGFFLIHAKLDHVGNYDGASDDTSSGAPLSFVNMAEMLVEELADRGGPGLAPVLIVGEERLGHSVAEIIRLRFPACDIWHLPFTAHEYGYLVAQLRPPEELVNFRARVRNNVDPRQHRNNSPPDDQSCYLEPIRRLWKMYYDATTDRERDNFFRLHDQELITLARQQETLLCRLFADAFATFFVGPAYVNALLHLRFVPDQTLYRPSVTMPPFAHRFFFALETLKWMSEELSPDENKPPLFVDELEPSTGIPDLWRKTTNDPESEDRYKEMADAYDLWLRQIKWILNDSFSVSFNEIRAIWEEAQELKDVLLSAKAQVPDWPSICAILNAAWLARWDNLHVWRKIQHNALSLLKKDPATLNKSSSIQAPKPTGKAMSFDEADLKIVTEALFSTPELLEKFEMMVKSRILTLEEEILTTLGRKNRDAYNAYLRLRNQ
jgi:hypothetical protein